MRSRTATQAPAFSDPIINGTWMRLYFSAQNAQIDIATAGKVRSTSNQPRQIQLGWKYLF